MKTYSENLNSVDIARLAGVSQATVSRVLSGSAKVSAETRARVMRVVNKSGYKPNLFAQAMRTRRCGTVGVAVSRITNPVMPELLETLASKFSELGRRVVVWNTDTEGVTGVMSAIRQGSVDGVVFTAAGHQSDALHQAIESGLPVVSINRHLDDVECEQFVSTNFDGARQIAHYLSGHDRKSIAFVNGPKDRTTLADREAGFRTGLLEAGIELRAENYASSKFSHNLFREIAVALASRSNPPDAIACGNDLIAMGVLNGLKFVGASVPDDIWVTGFDGIEMTGWDLIDLTTMQQPLETMAADAAEALVNRIEGRNSSPRIIQYKNELIVRGSTARAPVPGIS